MEAIYNHETFLLFLGGIFTLLLPVGIIFATREMKRNNERERLKVIQDQEPEAVGDIEAKLKDSYEFRRLNLLHLITEYALQPLFIISFINLFYSPSTFEIIIVFILVLFIIQHELWSAKLYSGNIYYQLLMFVLWIGLFFIISYKTNNLEKKSNPPATTEEQKVGK